MVHMSSLEILEWYVNIFCSAPTLTTHVDHLLFIQHKQTQSSKSYAHSLHFSYYYTENLEA